MDNFDLTDDRKPDPFQKGNPGMALSSLIFGILALAFSACAPPMALVCGSFGILFSVLSKGTRRRMGSARTGLALSVPSILISVFFILISIYFMAHPLYTNGTLDEYFNIIIHPDEYSQDDLDDWFNEQISPEDTYPADEYI